MGRRSTERGQAVLELACVLPLLLTLTFAVLAVGRIAQERAAVAAVAGEAARAASLAASPAAALERGQRQGALTASGYDLTNGSLRVLVDTSAFRRGGRVAAEARYTADLADLPLLGWARVPLASVHVEPIDPYRSAGLGGTP